MSPDRQHRPRHVRGKSLIPAPVPRRPARIFYVVSEGQVTERDYCTALNNHFGLRCDFHISTSYIRSKGLSPLEVAKRAISGASDAGEPSGQGADTSPHPLRQVWALFDCDEHRDVRQAFDALREHNEAAKERGTLRVEIAFSSPSFDLWLLLHFQTLANPQYGSSSRVHEKLRGHPAFKRFAVDTSRSKAITPDRAAQLMTPGRIETAVRNARALLKACPTQGCSPSAGHTAACDPLCRDPSTDVWRLIDSLGITSTCRQEG